MEIGIITELQEYSRSLTRTFYAARESTFSSNS